MTIDEAIRILDPETTAEALAEIEYYNGFTGKTAAVQAVSDACVLAVDALREQEERENPQPLTLDELRQIHAPVWCSCELFGGGNGFWCLCQNGKIIAPSGGSFDVEEIPNWVFLRSKPKEDA